MKRISIIGPVVVFLVFLAILVMGCRDRLRDTAALQSRVDSLQQLIRQVYVPGYGELMLNIQIHHAKLWYAGSKGNWELALYNESLIRSAFKKIRLYHPTDPNTAATTMIDGPLDSIATAISLKSPAAFRKSFDLLTVTCNNCHTVTNHAFNVITIPRTEPFGNQDFSTTLNTH